MQLSEVLDVVTALHAAAEHPDVTDIKRYGRDPAPGGQSPSGVRVYYRSGSSAMLWGAVAPKPAPATAPLPEVMPPPNQRAMRMLTFTIQLLDFARPPVFTKWESCAFPGVNMSPSALRIVAADGTTTYLRATVAAGPNREPEEDRHPDYQIPEGVREWPLKARVPSAVPE